MLTQLGADALIEPSNYVLIINLRRPFTTNALNDMLSEHGKVDELWLSDNKTHCIVKVKHILLWYKCSVWIIMILFK